jgi:hypothetical protein
LLFALATLPVVCRTVGALLPVLPALPELWLTTVGALLPVLPALLVLC